jgi:hypothetical protein
MPRIALNGLEGGEHCLLPQVTGATVVGAVEPPRPLAAPVVEPAAPPVPPVVVVGLSSSSPPQPAAALSTSHAASEHVRRYVDCNAAMDRRSCVDGFLFQPRV